MHQLRACLLSSALSALSAFVGPVVAAETPASTEVAEDRRLLRCYDFEETINGRYVGEFERLPIDWYAIGRTAGIGDVNFTRVPVHKQLVEAPGYPSWTEVRYDDRHSTSGRYSLYLGLDGGNAGAFVRMGALPAMPGSDYVITAAVRTTPLQHASVRVSASFIDAVGRRIQDSVVSNEPLREAEQWHHPVLWLSADQAQAAWIGLQVELIQDASRAGANRVKHRIERRQVQGGAWIDDLCVWQVPRVAVRTQNRVNIIRAPQRPQFTTHVRDLSGQALTARLDIHDLAGSLVASTTQPIGAGTPPPRPWTPPLPRFGWYLTELTVVDQDPRSDQEAAGSTAASAHSAVLWVPEEPDSDPPKLQPFMLLAEGVNRDELELLADVAEQSGIKSVGLSAWETGSTPANLDKRRAMLDSVLDRLWAHGATAALSLVPVPDELRRELDIESSDALGMLSRSSQRWAPLLNPVLMRYGHRVRQWRLGSMTRPADVDTPARIEACREARRHVSRLLPSPQIVLPWQVSRPPVSDLDGVVEVAINVPASVQADRIGSYAKLWSGAPFTMHLQVPPATALTQPRRCADLALRMLYAWESGATGLSLNRPWTPLRGNDASLVPDPVLGVFATMARRLAGRRAAGRLPLGPGLRCILFDSEEGSDAAVLAAWNRSAPSEGATVEMELGGEPVAVDVFGNRTPLSRGPQGHRMALSAAPVLIEGVDCYLARFRASFAVEPAFVESRQSFRAHRLWLTNPWPRSISGSLQIIGPPDWTFEPKRRSFTMSAGESIPIAMTLTFPASEVVGYKTLTARVNVETDRPFTVDLTAALTLGLPDLSLNATVDVEPNPDTDQLDAVVTQVISNLGSQTVALYAFCNVAGFGRQEVMIPRLKPAARVSRQFRFPGGADSVRSAPVRVGLREEAGPAILNKMITMGGR